MNIPRGLGEIREYGKRRAYPIDVLSGLRSGLLLFGAGFYGATDGIRFLDAGLIDVSVVDLDSMRLGVMRALYPSTWTFVIGDVWDWLREAREGGMKWDIVSLDPPSDIAESKVAEMLKGAEAVSNRFVVCGASAEEVEREGVRIGDSFGNDGEWRVRTVVERNSTLITWIVLERADTGG